MTAAIAPDRRIAPILRSVHDANWLTADRAKLFSVSWLAISVIVAVAWLLLARNNLDLLGKPVGTDFVSFWTASQATLAGHPWEVYNMAQHHVAQTRLFGRDIGDYAFFYPPMFLLLCLPLAGLPYLVSLGAWLGVTGVAYARVVRACLGEHGGWIAVLAFPAVLINVGHGQNGFLSAALFGGGSLLLDRRPVLAGAILGCLIYKPHIGLVIPVALIASGRWRTILGAAGSAAVLILLSIWAFGLATWRAFLGVSPMARAALERNLVGDAKMQSVFAAVRLLHGSLGLAYAAQGAMALGVCAALVLSHRKAFRSPAEGPAMVAAALLISPFLLDYDLILLAIPLAWLTAQGLAGGFRPWEKTILAAAFVLPAVSRNIATATGAPVGPVVVLAVFWLVLRRWEAAARAFSASIESIEVEQKRL
jgi:hypothetical protein